jgi:hypothetical protein
MSFIPASPTSLGTWLTCPRQFEAKYVTKEVVFQPSEASLYGDRIHKAMEDRIGKNTPLPSEAEHLEPVAAAVVAAPGYKLVERSLPVDRDGRACEWRERYYGGRADLVSLNGKTASVLDWKTGKYKRDNLQLTMLTSGVFAHYPEVKQVKAALVFLKTGDLHEITARRDGFKPTEMMQQITDYEGAQRVGDYPPCRSGLCKQWCDVLRCEFNGRNK